MSTVQRGRLDLLALALAEQAYRQWVEPQLAIPAWERGLGGFVYNTIQRAGVPSQPVTHIQLGNLRLPVALLEYVAESAGLIPRRLSGG